MDQYFGNMNLVILGISLNGTLLLKDQHAHLDHTTVKDERADRELRCTAVDGMLRRRQEAENPRLHAENSRRKED